VTTAPQLSALPPPDVRVALSDPRSWALPVAVDWRPEFVSVQVLCWSWTWVRKAIPARVVAVAVILAGESERRRKLDEEFVGRLMRAAAERN
jgi:hypothetical protein